MKILQRTEWGNPILRKKAKPVSIKTIDTPAFRKLVKDMIYTMHKTQGVGLAAPQIGKSIQLAVIEMYPTKTRPSLEKKGPIVVINPKIIKASRKMENDWEGCLSFEGVRGHVPRHHSIEVSYLNEKGEKVVEEAKGFWARIFQHEIDHLNGNVYADRMEDMQTLMTFNEYKKRVLKTK